MKADTIETVLVLGAALLGLVLAVGAVGATLWAVAARRSKRGAATLALCLWCAVAGGTLSSALWSWMTTTNFAYQRFQIARLPAGTKAVDVKFQAMQMLVFYINLDRFGRRLLYLTVLLPLVFAVVIFRKARSAPEVEKPTKSWDESMDLDEP